jgi:DNA-binding MarR family transcriptional regulator
LPGKLQHELSQSRACGSLEEEAFLNVQRTAGVLAQRVAELLKPHGLSPTQYNVLRILRGAGDGGAACKDIAARMIAPDPDITRLVDRLEKRGLVTRSRSVTDRRRVPVRITESGRTLLAELDAPILAASGAAMAPLAPAELTTLISLLERLRT